MKKPKIILITILFLCVTLSIVLMQQKANIENKTKVVKQMSESEQVSSLETQINQYIASHTEYANSIQAAKKNLATAITNEGVTTSENDTFEMMTTNIAGILQARISDATATADNIIEGKTAYVNGNKVTGTLPSATSNEIYYIGTGESFNVQELTGLEESILSKLTANNFIVEILNLSSTNTGAFTGQPGGLSWSANAKGTTISKTYDTASFTLTLSGCNQILTCNRIGNSDWPSTSISATQSITYKVYLILGDIKNI